LLSASMVSFAEVSLPAGDTPLLVTSVRTAVLEVSEPV